MFSLGHNIFLNYEFIKNGHDDMDEMTIFRMK